MASLWHRCGRDCDITRLEVQHTLKLKYRNQPLTQMGYPPAHMYSGITPKRPPVDKLEKVRRDRDRELTEINRRVKVLGPDMKYHWFLKSDWDEHGSDLLRH